MITNRSLEEDETCEITISGKSVYEGIYLINLSTVSYSFETIADVKVPGFSINLNKIVDLSVKGFDGNLLIYFSLKTKTTCPQIRKYPFLKGKCSVLLYDNQSSKFTYYFLFKFVQKNNILIVWFY